MRRGWARPGAAWLVSARRGAAGIGAARYGRARQGMDYTSLEVLLIEALQAREVIFRSQVPTRTGFVLDFLIAPNIVLEADGPCHDGSKNRKRDRARDRILKKSGYVVHRLPYTLIEDREKLDARLDDILLR